MLDALSYIYDAECYKFTGKERDRRVGPISGEIVT